MYNVYVYLADFLAPCTEQTFLLRLKCLFTSARCTSKAAESFQGSVSELNTEVEGVEVKSVAGYVCVLRKWYVDVTELQESSPEVVKFLERSKRKSPVPEIPLSECAKMMPSAKGN